jgi:hypothetical protein
LTPPPGGARSARFAVEFLGDNLGLRLEKNMFQTRGACVVHCDFSQTQSRAGMARDVRPGDALISVNGASLLLPTLEAVISTIAEAPLPRAIVFERRPSNLTGFATLTRRGNSGLARFLQFCVDNRGVSKKSGQTAAQQQQLHAMSFFVEGRLFSVLASAGAGKDPNRHQDPTARYRYAQLLWRRFLEDGAVCYIDPRELIPMEIRANISEILGLVKSQLLLEVPLDSFDEALAAAARYVAAALPAFCKSPQFDAIKTKQPPLKLSLRDHILASRRGINCFLTYCLQTREHAALLCYLDAHELVRRAEISGAVSADEGALRTFSEKYHGADALLPVAFCANVAESSLPDIQENALCFLERGPAQRFLFSPICARLMGPSDAHADLTNLVEDCHLARGIEFYRRPVATTHAGKESLLAAGASGCGATAVGDLLGLGTEEKANADSAGTSSDIVSNTATVDALVVFEADVNTGKVKTVEQILRGGGSSASPPSVDAFYIPHGVKSDLDFQELNTATTRSRRANSSGTLHHRNEAATTAAAAAAAAATTTTKAPTNGGNCIIRSGGHDFFPGAFAYNLMFAPPGGAEGKTWSAAVVVNPRERSTETGSFAPAGIALFSQDACATRMRTRLAQFALQSMQKGEEAEEAEGAGGVTAGAANDASIVSKIRGSRSSHALLAPITAFDVDGDERTFLRMMNEVLPPKALVDLLTCALLERKILFVSKNYSLLTAAAACLQMLLKPLRWQHLCIPVLPRSMIDTLECPTPFIIGVNSVYAFKRDFPFVLDLVIVDLDAGTIQSQQADADMAAEGDEGDAALMAVKEAIASRPSKLQQQLLFDLRIVMRPFASACDDLLWPPLPGNVDVLSAVKRLFKAYIVTLLEGVENCSFAMTNGDEALAMFDRKRYVAKHGEDERTFLKGMATTAAFSRLVADTTPRAHKF